MQVFVDVELIMIFLIAYVMLVEFIEADSETPTVIPSSSGGLI